MITGDFGVSDIRVSMIGSNAFSIQDISENEKSHVCNTLRKKQHISQLVT